MAKIKTITVQRGIPAPEGKIRTRMQFPWADMKPGDSFFVPGYSQQGDQGPKLGIAGAYLKHPGSSWKVRNTTERNVPGVRVWRTS